MATDTTGWETLGSVLGGGVDTEGAFEKGRLRTAQTENALMQARNRQLEGVALEAKNKARAQLEDALVKTGKYTPEEVRMMATVMNGELGTDFAATTQGMLRTQEYGNRDILGNPEAPLGDQFAAGQAVQGKVLSPYEMLGSGDFVDLRASPAPGGAPAVGTTPLGESMIAENNASAGASNATANLRRVQSGDPDYQTVGSGGPTVNGLKPPNNFMPNPAYNPALPMSSENAPFAPIPGSPADPNVGPAMGVRERAVIGRVFNSAANTANDLGNIVAMPSGANIGHLGVGLGATPGSTVFDAVAGKMKLALSPQEVRRYNDTLGGLTVQLRTLEQMGMQGTQGLADQYAGLAFRPEDTIADKMYKLAIVRQTTENALTTILSLNRNMPDEAKGWAQQTLASLAQAVPYSPRDVIELEARQATDPTVTLQQVINEKRGASPASPAAPARGGPAAPVPAAPAPAGAPAVEKWERGPDGKLRRVPAAGAR